MDVRLDLHPVGTAGFEAAACEAGGAGLGPASGAKAPEAPQLNPRPPESHSIQAGIRNTANLHDFLRQLPDFASIIPGTDSRITGFATSKLLGDQESRLSTTRERAGFEPSTSKVGISAGWSSRS